MQARSRTNLTIPFLKTPRGLRLTAGWAYGLGFGVYGLGFRVEGLGVKCLSVPGHKLG